MKILSHRGYWKIASEKNTEVAFRRSFELGYGTETDLRDANGKLVICHDLPTGGEMPLEQFLEIFKPFKNLPLAINIKSDGLQDILKKALNEYGLENYFLFDMSIPDTVKSLAKGLTCFARESEYEVPTPTLLQGVKGIWYDHFSKSYLNLERIHSYLGQNKIVCLVSPELHGRDHKPFWSELMQNNMHKQENLWICTDIPEDLQLAIKE
ncbi:hypothetical protein DOM22_09355 [Bdellovibrio sp. ZAP7]|uniref:hypothetical protein n=1 Tax=Bdellovibrio sp. ZAP7 TaxID=2231053 RepID=UPI001159C5EE|nr:hypothetical protein [Bdellovibrio sp. ZAP7]QDK47448.1 hypothetical protein DOM22_09355 [Bdellovibrio sp. ZAP7]